MTKPGTVYFLLLGVVSLLPWNTVITATDYFHSRFRLVRPLQNFEAIFSLVYMASQLFGLLLQIYLEWCASFQHNVIAPTSIAFGIFSTLSISIFIEMHTWTYFYFVLLSIVSLGVCSVFISGGGFAAATHLNSPELSNTFVLGQGFAGLLISIVRYILHLSIDADDLVDVNSKSTALVYFSSVAALLLITTIMSIQMSLRYPNDNDKLQLQSADIELMTENSRLADCSNPIIYNDNMCAVTVDKTKPSLLHTVFQLRYYSLSLVFIFAVTLSVFPAVTSEVRACATSMWSDGQLVSLLFLLYNASDVVGRWLSKYSQEFTDSTLPTIYTVSFLRLLLLPALIGATNVNYQLTNRASCNDIVPIVATCLLGCTTGYAASCCFMHWPRCVQDEEKTIGATIMVLATAVGLCIGAISSNAIIGSLNSAAR